MFVLMKIFSPTPAQARNYEDHQLYVLKRIPFDDAAKTDAAAALREANVLGAISRPFSFIYWLGSNCRFLSLPGLLRHPHVVPYKEFFNHEDSLCLVMAHCEGGDLFQYIRQKR